MTELVRKIKTNDLFVQVSFPKYEEPLKKYLQKWYTIFV